MGVYDTRPWKSGYKLANFALAQTFEPYPEVPAFKLLDDTAAAYPNRPACLYLGNHITWRELHEQVDRLASALADLGIGKGDKVATILPTCPQFVISEYAIQKTGSAHVPCSPLHRERDLIWELGESGARAIICLNRSCDLVKSVKAETALESVILTHPREYAAEPAVADDEEGTLQFQDLLAAHEPEPPDVEIDPREDLALLVFTGGATGRPKGVMLTHFNMVANTMQLLPWVLGPLEKGVKGKASILIGVPVFHAYGHLGMRSAVNWGLQMIMIPDPRDNAAIAEALKSRPFLATLVPTQYMRLTEEKLTRTNTTFTSGAAPLPPEVGKRFRKVTGMPITEAYGLTETGPLTHFNLSSFAKITGFMPFEKTGSIGLPVVDTESKVVDPGTGKEVPQGEVGELYVRGPQVMKGYWPTAGDGLEDGWLPTGDLCRMDEDGYFFLVDRTKDMINVSGNKVYSTVVDDVLFEHPAVSVAAAIGIPDPERPGSERIKAFVVLSNEYKGEVGEDEIIAHCREKLPPYAVPRTLEFRDALPLTVTEKVFKKVLRDEEVAQSEEA
jgi:long-chain acyl-CoA synthetase